LEFIDSTGIRVMFQAFEHPQLNGWKFQIDPDIAPQAMQVFKLVGMDVLIVAENSTGR
jgi:anti-anti-sigma regulatory factor